MEPKIILLAPNAFKETYSASEMAALLERLLRPSFPEAYFFRAPIADGGDGSVAAVHTGKGGTIVKKKVIGPYQQEVEASYLLIDRTTAFIEMALSSGLALTKIRERNPLLATTYGFGQLIKDAIDKGCDRLYLGIGGSATNDGGIGMAQALGARFIDKDGKEVSPRGEVLCANDIDHVKEIMTEAMDRMFDGVKVIIASDVENPLLGPEGATAVYGSQKGATKDQLKILEVLLTHLSDVVESHYGRSFRDLKGSGAAGGLGFGLLSFCHAEMESGFSLIADLIGLEQKISRADLIFTGEGKIDRQTAYGKAIAELGKLSGKKPVIAIAGSLGKGYEGVFKTGIDLIGYLKEPVKDFDAVQMRKDTPELMGRLMDRIIIKITKGLESGTTISAGDVHG